MQQYGASEAEGTTGGSGSDDDDENDDDGDDERFSYESPYTTTPTMTPNVGSQKKKKKKKRKKKMSRGSLHTSAFNQRRLGSLDTPTSSHGNSGSSSARLGHVLSPSFSSENRVRSLRQARKSLVETSPAHDTPRSRKQNEEADDFIECVSDRLTQGEDVIFILLYD